MLRHNAECADCEYRARCMGGCRAAALDNTPDDILGRDMGCCTFYKDGWEQKARAAAEEAIARFGEKP